MRYTIDIEADNLLREATKIHCVAYCDNKTGEVKSITDYDKMREFFCQEDVVFVGHNIILYDIPVVERILGIKVKAKLWDTLGLSWILYPERLKHGLESWGETFGIEKPKIEDWNSLKLEDYVHRCTEDVKINYQLWKKIAGYLAILYDKNTENAEKYLDYISFKLDCVKEHQELGVNFDKELCEKSLKELEEIKIEKTNALRESMPKVGIKSIKLPPRVMYKKDGSPSENRLKWLKFLEEQGLPMDYNQEVEYISGYEEPNPNSNTQIKNWLFSLGWEPTTFKYVKEEGKKEMRKIPQIMSSEGGGEICDSVKKLVEKEPALENLDSLSILSHRIALFKGFLRDDINGRLYQNTQGFTNTLRLQHQIIVNLPNATKKYSENIRKCLIPDEGKIMLGCDLSGIEDSTKRHYIYKYDPEYVESMNTKGYDPHLELAVLAGFLTKEQAEKHKSGEENYKEYRQKAKTANFALTYKCGIATLVRQTGLKEKQAKLLSDAYWKRNKAILDVKESLKIKTVGNHKWLQNPVSGFWYSLRNDKDKFSTLNQGTAVYCFDRWLYYVRQSGIKVNFQVHDEWSSCTEVENKEIYEQKVKKAVELVNNELKLNITIGCSLDWGYSYTECH